MRSTLPLLAFGAVASASAAALHNRQNYPACVGTCIGTEAAAAGCNTQDAKCLCTSSTFIDTVAQCFATSCDASDAATGVALGEQLCAAVGYTESIPAYASSVLASGAGSGAAATSSVSPVTESSAASSILSSASSIASSSSSVASKASSASASSPSTSAATAATVKTGAGTALTRNTVLAGLSVILAILAVV